MIYPRKTKIICTIGPATESIENLRLLVSKGMNIARLNFSHGSYEKHKQTVANLRQVCDECNSYVAILQDLQGPKIRTEKVENGAVNLEEGQDFIITTREIELGNSQIVSTSYLNLPNDLKANDTILIDDGYLIVKVEKIEGTDIFCKVIKGGILKDRKGLIAPNVVFSAPALSDKDIEDLKFGLSIGVDMVALSFVSSGRDIVELKTTMKIFGRSVPIVAKIERPEAIKNIDSIMEECDAMMIARGDLGLEYPVEDVPLLQKDLINKCNTKGMPVITATQMLESMINNPRPTRAEASDVANAVFDSSDALMLSGETSVGKYPIIALENMTNIIKKVEDKIYNIPFGDRLYQNLDNNTMDAIAHAATAIAEQINASAIVVLSNIDNAIKKVAKYRPRIPLLGITNNIELLRRMSIIWGVQPILIEGENSFQNVFDYLSKNKNIIPNIGSGDNIVFVSGLNNPFNENTIKVYKY
ncbi:MAG TPA: pyruvate kinase [Candidatus Kapabacteria bacterium]|nr:pyruvate kinase [Candidatus Kapabacteria bacterium]